MRNKMIIIITFLFSVVALACPVCDAKQPKGFKNITHGEGPEGNIDYLIMYSAIIIVGYTLIMSVKYLTFPKEHKHNEIKNSVIKD